MMGARYQHLASEASYNAERLELICTFSHDQSSMKLPLFVNAKNKLPAGAIMYGLGYILYFLTNHYPVFEPKLMNLNAVDRAVPFLPYTVIIYTSEYFYFAFVYLLLKNYKNINQYLYSFFTLQVVSCVIFVIYPTIYPRELFPIPSEYPAWLQRLWIWLRTQDAATNCFPSLHVSSVYISAWAFLRDGNDRSSKIKFWAFFIWATLIALSTLTTKQHYLVDIICGFLLSILYYRRFHIYQQYKPIHNFSPSSKF